jgi:hypothetical protein
MRKANLSFRSKKRIKLLSFILLTMLPFTAFAKGTFDISSIGLRPGTNVDATPYLIKAIKICKEHSYTALTFPRGTYMFYPDKATAERFFILAHDHHDITNVGIDLHEMKNFIIDGNGSDFIFHGNMLPVSISDCRNITVRNFSIDFDKPFFTQALITEATPDYFDIQFSPNVEYSVENNKLYIESCIGKRELSLLMLFDKEHKFVVPHTGDIYNHFSPIEKIGDKVRLHGYKSGMMKKGEVLFLRNTIRPNPGIFNQRCKNLHFENIDIYWSEGMGIMSQRCENVSLNHFNVRLRDGSDRYFTTNDAVNFGLCKGQVSVTNGLFENMLDDGSNTFGDYFEVTKISSDRKTIVIAFKHQQSFGLEAVLNGEKVQFVHWQTMMPLGEAKAYKTRRVDDYHTEITFRKTVPDSLNIKDCIENIEWTPSLVYRNNTVRNNRARGMLLGNPRKAVVENNLFDHCSGTGVILSSDCHSWFMSGPCKNVTVRGNRFIDCLTNKYQLCDGIVSIFPEMSEIPQKGYYHSNIDIEHNYFTVPEGALLLYAKSVKGLTFAHNTYETFNNSKTLGDLIQLVKCSDVKIFDNKKLAASSSEQSR